MPFFTTKGRSERTRTCHCHRIVVERHEGKLNFAPVRMEPVSASNSFRSVSKTLKDPGKKLTVYQISSSSLCQGRHGQERLTDAALKMIWGSGWRNVGRSIAIRRTSRKELLLFLQVEVGSGSRRAGCGLAGASARLVASSSDGPALERLQRAYDSAISTCSRSRRSAALCWDAPFNPGSEVCTQDTGSGTRFTGFLIAS
jgi:hypothetical protein